MTRARYQLRQCEEDRQQLYWGAFMLGCAAFHQHRHAGYWLDNHAVGRLAAARFAALLGAVDQGAYVDDEDWGQVRFCCAFLDGYGQRLRRCGTDGLVQHNVPVR